MKYSLDIYLITNNQAIIDAVKSDLPARLDVTVWPNEYELVDSVNMDGNKFIAAMIRFNDITNRQAIKTKIQDRLTPTILSQIFSGSYIKLHTCDHDTETGRTGCVVTEIWSK